MKIPPKFREFYAARYPGPWPCPVGAPIEQPHRQLAEAAADYLDMIAAQVFGEELEEGCDHASDCAVHNEPAYPNGRCDGGAA